MLEPSPSAVGADAGVGLNLSEDVRDGILCHSGRAPMPATLEGRIVRIVDRVAYVNHDIDDALRAGVLDAADLPAGPIAVLGGTGSQRIDALVHDLVESSEVAGDIVQGPEAGPAMDELRDFMFEQRVPRPAGARRARAHRARDHDALRALRAGPSRIPDGGGAPGAGEAQRVVDYIAGMTDRFCIRVFEELTVPESFAA